VNVRRGLRRKDERPPEDHWAVRDERYEQELLSKYYAFKGWNGEGIPTRRTLEQLDLAYAADDLEQRGILAAAAGVSACEPAATAEPIRARMGG
jgi:aldehyde:ferredoxin oxidoreductase